MDPLSILVSTITIAGATRAAIRKVQDIKQGQPQIHALANELSDLTIILLELEKCLRSGQSRQNPQFLQSLVTVRTKLNSLAENITSWVDGFTPSSEQQDQRRFRWLRAGGKAKSFRDELFSLKSEFATILAAVNTSTSSRIEVDVQQIYMISSDVATEQRHLHNKIETTSRAQLAEIRQLNTSMNTLRSETTTAGHNRSQIISLGRRDAGVSTVDPGTEKDLVRAFHHNGSILFESEQMSAISAVGIRTAHFSRSACTPWCACRCHTRRQWQSPSLMGRVLGSLFIGYSGMPIARLECDERSCQLRSQPMIYVSYFFPPWFLARAMSMVFSSTPLAGPVISLKMQRTIPGNSDIFTFAIFGKVDRMKSLFEQGLASPHDVHFESGITPLHMAISYKQIDACRFLLQANADPFLEDRSQRTAADNAWTKIFSKAFPQELENQIREMFSDTECLERRDFTMLHRIVLGLVGKDLATELQASTKDLNTQDSSGRTTLLMAAERNDVEAVKLLLEHGADPNIMSSDRGSPLHFAATAHGPCCIAPLLAHAALFDRTTSWRQTALHYVAAYRNDERPARLLLEAGADLNARDLDGITPLQWAVVSGSEKVARVLLEHGADVNNTDKYNDSTLLSALIARRHTILAMLLDHGISLEGLYVKGGTILHGIANSADIESMKILQRLDLSHIPLDAPDDQGLTALDIFQSRTDRSTELADAFSQLLSSSGPAVLRTRVDSGGGESMVPDPGDRVALPERAPSTDPVHHLEGSRNTIAAMKRTFKGMNDAGKLLQGMAVNTKLQRDALFIALLGIVIAMLCRNP